MSEAFILDTGPLGLLVNPRPNREITELLIRLLDSGTPLYLPEIADYELRRNLILEGLDKSIERLNRLKDELIFLPISTSVMLQAAQFWANARKAGLPSASKDALDGDVILAAQAKRVNAIVLTENVGHLARFVKTKSWKELL